MATKSANRTVVKPPVPAHAPRIMVTAENGSVASMVRAAGGAVVDGGHLVDTMIDRLADCHGLIVTGGVDVNPALYGATERHPQTQSGGAGRDYRELALLGAAREMGIPVLGICRGLQVITVEAGGALYQHVPDRVGHNHHDYSMMPVNTVRGSVVARALGPRPNVLHLHHQSLRRTPAGFQVTARHDDGTVEAIESNDGRVVATQFHPESVLVSARDAADGLRLFQVFVRSCSRYRRRSRREGVVLPHTASHYLSEWPAAVDAYEGTWSGYYSWDSKADRFVPSMGPRGNASSKPKGSTAPSFKSTDRRATGLGTIEHKRDGSATLTLRDGDEIALDVARDTEAGYCYVCKVSFDVLRDYEDHMDILHPYIPGA